MKILMSSPFSLLADYSISKENGGSEAKTAFTEIHRPSLLTTKLKLSVMEKPVFTTKEINDL